MVMILPCLLWGLQPFISPQKSYQDIALLAAKTCEVSTLARAGEPAQRYVPAFMQLYAADNGKKASAHQPDFLFPLVGKWSVTSAYGPRLHPLLGRVLPHRGADFAVPVSSEVLAVQNARVLTASYSPTAGYYIELSHGNDWTSTYMHLQSLNVAQGDEVKQGDVIALSGATGRVTGPHLHLEMRYKKVGVDPVGVFNGMMGKMNRKPISRDGTLPRIVLVSGSGEETRVGIKAGRKIIFARPGSVVFKKYRVTMLSGKYRLEKTNT